jgi:hypothetical protein
VKSHFCGQLLHFNIHLNHNFFATTALVLQDKLCNPRVCKSPLRSKYHFSKYLMWWSPKGGQPLKKWIF